MKPNVQMLQRDHKAASAHPAAEVWEICPASPVLLSAGIYPQPVDAMSIHFRVCSTQMARIDIQKPHGHSINQFLSWPVLNICPFYSSSSLSLFCWRSMPGCATDVLTDYAVHAHQNPQPRPLLLLKLSFIFHFRQWLLLFYRLEANLPPKSRCYSK